MSTKSVMAISDRATMMVAQNERYASVAEVADESTRAALAVVGKTEIEVAFSSRDAYMVSGHAIHDIQTAFDPEKWVSHNPAFKNAGELISWVFPSISSAEASARAKVWEAWGDPSKLDATKKAIWDAGTSPNALYRLTQVPGEMLKAESDKGHNYFTLQEGKELAKAAKETKRPKVAKKWAAPDGTPWEGDSAPDTLSGEDTAFSLPNGDKVLCHPVETDDRGTVYEFVQLREVKPEPKRKAATRPLDASQAVKNMSPEQQAEVLAALLASMGKTLAD